MGLFDSLTKPIKGLLGGGGGGISRPNPKNINKTLDTWNPEKFQTPDQTSFLDSFKPAASESLNKARELGGKLGSLDPAAFEGYYAPIRAEQDRQFTKDTGTLESSLASRGLLPQGSFAAPGGNSPGGGPSTESSTYGGPMGELFHEQNLARDRSMQEAATNAESANRADYSASVAGTGALAAPYQSNIVDPNKTLDLYSKLYGVEQNTQGQESAQAEAVRAHNRGALWDVGTKGAGAALTAIFCWIADALYGSGSQNAYYCRHWIIFTWKGFTADCFRFLYGQFGVKLSESSIALFILRPLFNLFVVLGKNDLEKRLQELV